MLLLTCDLDWASLGRTLGHPGRSWCHVFLLILWVRCVHFTHPNRGRSGHWVLEGSPSMVQEKPKICPRRPQDARTEPTMASMRANVSAFHCDIFCGPLLGDLWRLKILRLNKHSVLKTKTRVWLHIADSTPKPLRGVRCHFAPSSSGPSPSPPRRTMPLSKAQHDEVLSLVSCFKLGNDESKNVAIRGRLGELFGPHLMSRRLLPHQVGIMPNNRDGEGITAVGVLIRGRRIYSSGFSKYAAGRLWGFEDHPQTRHIAKNTAEIVSMDPGGFAKMREELVRIGSANLDALQPFLSHGPRRGGGRRHQRPTV